MGQAAGSARPARSPRSDGARNRDRVLEAASAVFGEVGADAPTAEVARRAGVGIATVFRHFPTKSSLLQAVFDRELEAAALEAEELARSPHPGATFLPFLSRLAESSNQKLGLVDALGGGEAAARPGSALDARFRQALDALLRFAQEDAVARRDVDVSVVLGVLACAAQVPSREAALAHRIRSVMLDGLRM